MTLVKLLCWSVMPCTRGSAEGIHNRIMNTWWGTWQHHAYRTWTTQWKWVNKLRRNNNHSGSIFWFWTEIPSRKLKLSITAQHFQKLGQRRDRTSFGATNGSIKLSQMCHWRRWRISLAFICLVMILNFLLPCNSWKDGLQSYRKYSVFYSRSSVNKANRMAVKSSLALFLENRFLARPHSYSLYKIGLFNHCMDSNSNEK